MCARPVENEFFSSVTLNLKMKTIRFQQAVSVSARPEINPNRWRSGDPDTFGCSSVTGMSIGRRERPGYCFKRLWNLCFRCHDTIEPMTTWRRVKF